MQDTLDVWCCSLEDQMKVSVSKDIMTALHEAVDIGSDKFMDWVAKYPCQMLLVCLDIKFTSVIQDIFM
jgi:hypothetical protein